MGKKCFLLKLARVLWFISIFFILLSVVSYTLLSKYITNKGIDNNELTIGIFFLGFAIYLTSSQIKSIHTGILKMGWYWPWEDIKREKNPNFFWIVFHISNLVIIFLYYLAFSRILGSMTPEPSLQEMIRTRLHGNQ